MKEKLRELHAHLSGRPQISTSNGVVVAITPSSHGPHSVQFACAEDAHWFATCFDAVPALLDELAESERRQAPGTTEALEAELLNNQLAHESRTLEMRAVEERLELELLAHEKTRGQARHGALIGRRYVELYRRAEALQTALDAAQARLRSLEPKVEDLDPHAPYG